MRLYPKGRNQKRFPFFAGVWKMYTKHFISMKEAVEANSEVNLYKPSLDILGEVSHKMSSA